jgi:uncharacterized membrane protein
MTYLLLLHVLAVVVCVGRMDFAHVARPAVAATPEPPGRFALTGATRGLSFPSVTIAIVVLVVTGFGMIVGMGGFRGVGAPIHAMAGIGLAMALIFVELRRGSFRRLRTGVAARAWPDAGAALGEVRTPMTINLVPGLVTIATAAVGRAGF